MVDEYKEKVVSTVEKDAVAHALRRARTISKKRGGKFKMSEHQFTVEMTTAWISGEFSAAERILRCIEADPELNSKDLIRGEIHIAILDLFKILKKRLDIKENLELEDLLWGKFTTENVVKEFRARENAKQ